MLALPQVTLCCVDTRMPQLALEAIARSTAGIRFGEVLLFTDSRLAPPAPPGVRYVEVEIASVQAYSEFMLRGIAPHIQTSHWLVVQWDGFVLDAAAWRPEFLELDYIGAPWLGRPRERSVGNGGFSLRSRRLLLALADPRMSIEHPEDVCICEANRERLEREHFIRFASPELAAAFAYERAEPPTTTFGFHGLFNFDRFMEPSELGPFLASLPDSMMRGLDAHDLAVRLLQKGRTEEAALILAARKRLGMRDRRTWRLRWRVWRARAR